MHYLQLVRYKNLILIALMQIILLSGFLKLQNIELALAIWQFYLLVFSTICIAAGGYIINNIFDTETDLINKPDKVVVGKFISENVAYNMYVALTLMGVSIGFYLSNVILRPSFLLFFIIPAALLYIYATSLKQIMIVGNLVIAAMLSYSILIVGIFMIIPATDTFNQKNMTTVLSVLVDFSIIAFILNFIREIVKDIEDYTGDKSTNIQTLPVAIGIANTTKIVAFLSIIPIVTIIYYVYFYLFELQWATFYIFLLILAPLFYFSAKIFTATTSNDFKKLSFLLKIIILFGILAIAVIGFNMQYNVT
jgi:4-hydroxybenzoate polyprenyltransferase